jgi:3-methyladenine DNA glycosylase AlkD
LPQAPKPICATSSIILDYLRPCAEALVKGLPDYKDLPGIVKELWDLPQREFQYFATELMAAHRKEWAKDIHELAEYMIVRKSWWDTVDHIATDITGPYFKLFPSSIASVTKKWNRSSDIWLQRSSIMFQKAYREKTDTELLSTYILHCKDSKEFFIQKAIGWALREYSKTNAAWVKQFVKSNKLAPLSAREALKRMK